jgi:hypothetical protein
MDVDDLQHALGGVVLESAYLERVLRAAFSALIHSKYAAVVDSRLTAATMIEDCERITQHHTDIPGAEKERLLAALKACHQANSHRNRVIHDAWATRPGDVMVTLHGSPDARDVTVIVRTPGEVRQVADRLADAANDVKAAMTAAFGPEWDLVEDQLRHELGRDVGAEGQRPDE